MSWYVCYTLAFFGKVGRTDGVSNSLDPTCGSSTSVRYTELSVGTVDKTEYYID